jgi:hypothetical protein
VPDTSKFETSTKIKKSEGNNQIALSYITGSEEEVELSQVISKISIYDNSLIR